MIPEFWAEGKKKFAGLGDFSVLYKKKGKKEGEGPQYAP